MRFVDLETSRRVQEAALLLLDACREAAKQSDAYKAGQSNIDEVTALAVQSLLMSDHWDGGEDRSTSIPSTEVALRIKGMAEGMGMSIGSLPPLSRMVVLMLAVRTVEKSVSDRGRYYGKERDFMGGGQ